MTLLTIINNFTTKVTQQFHNFTCTKMSQFSLQQCTFLRTVTLSGKVLPWKSHLEELIQQQKLINMVGEEWFNLEEKSATPLLQLQSQGCPCQGSKGVAFYQELFHAMTIYKSKINFKSHFSYIIGVAPPTIDSYLPKVKFSFHWGFCKCTWYLWQKKNSCLHK